MSMPLNAFSDQRPPIRHKHTILPLAIFLPCKLSLNFKKIQSDWPEIRKYLHFMKPLY